MNIDKKLANILDNPDACNDESDLLDAADYAFSLGGELDLLMKYCRKKADAIKKRKAGLIQWAKRIEKECETIYNQLPDNQKW